MMKVVAAFMAVVMLLTSLPVRISASDFIAYGYDMSDDLLGSVTEVTERTFGFSDTSYLFSAEYKETIMSNLDGFMTDFYCPDSFDMQDGLAFVDMSRIPQNNCKISSLVNTNETSEQKSKPTKRNLFSRMSGAEATVWIVLLVLVAVGAIIIFIPGEEEE